MLWLASVVALGGDVQIHRFSRGFVGVYVLEGEDGAVLVDSHYPRGRRWLVRTLDKAGLTERLTLLLLTHAHSDHAGGAAAMQALGVPVAVGVGDSGMLEAGDHGKPEPKSLLARMLVPTVPRHYPPMTPDLRVDGELDLAEYGVHATARVVGGHSEGSLAVWVGTEVVSGDLVRGGLTAHRRPRLHFFHEDTEGAHAGVRQLLDEGATTLWVAHGADLSAERLERWLQTKKIRNTLEPSP